MTEAAVWSTSPIRRFPTCVDVESKPQCRAALASAGARGREDGGIRFQPSSAAVRVPIKQSRQRERVTRLSPPNTIRYILSDHLDLHTLITSSAGAIQEESDYYLYGGEIVVSGTLSEAHNFTGKERDTESGNDYFGDRYYASTMGRFL